MDLRRTDNGAADVIAALGLAAHPEGGHYRELSRDVAADGGRGAMSAILFLLAAGEVSHWHRVDADELWIWQAGGPLSLSTSSGGHAAAVHRLGPDLSSGETLQHRVRADDWQSAQTRGAWTLVSCIVAPAFQFEGFELADKTWHPSSHDVS